MTKTGVLRQVRLMGLLVVFSLLASCGDNNPLAPGEERDENEIWITATGFEPTRLTIQLGESVVFTNKDTETHAIQSGTPNNPTALFSTRNLTNNNSQTVTINQKGTYVYHDIDSHVTGTIIIL
ncbi:MAG: hypothetical protein DWQ05_02620 [Calditrichaeota bacterium]|nr:MAG: hypothetical protein DWQ05_02620 [Calditrichota bacterium]